MSESTFGFDFRITQQDQEPIDVTSGPAEIIRVERKYDVGVGSFISEDGGLSATVRFEWLAYMAWSAQYRRTADDKRVDFEAWLDSLVDLEIEADKVTGIKVGVVGNVLDLEPDDVATARAEVDRLEELVRARLEADPTDAPPDPALAASSA